PMPLPTSRLSATDLQLLLADPTFGYAAAIPPYSKLDRSGDTEIGARFGVLQAERARAVATGTVILPTSVQSNSDNLVGISTGNRAFGLRLGTEIAIEPRPFSLVAAASYARYRGASIQRRITVPQQPIALASGTDILTRNLGDEVALTAFPGLEL